MRNINKSCEILFYIIPFVVSWMLIIHLAGIASILSIDTIKKIPDAVMYTGIFYILFSKYNACCYNPYIVLFAVHVDIIKIILQCFSTFKKKSF